MSANKLVIFDCDGTLVDSQRIIIDAMRLTFTDAGQIPVSDARVRSVVGLSPFEVMEDLLPDAEAALHRELEEKFKRTFYQLRVENKAGPDPLYDGTLEALRALDSAGYLLGVATGNSKRGLDRVIEEHGLEGLFMTMQTADGHPSKPHPSMIYSAIADAGTDVANTVMIGDTSYDMTMSAHAGSHALGVNWGYHSDEELLAAGARCVVERYGDIPRLVESWIGKA